MGVTHLIFVALALFAFSVESLNITDVLSGFPEYSLFNGYLTQTKVADDINSRQTITVLVLANPAMSALADKQPLSVIKEVLSLHVLLDYFDAAKLHAINNGTAIVTTLFQTTGEATGQVGFVNITDMKGGKVGFGSAVPGSVLDSTYTKEVKKIPYNISVLEISQPVISPGILAEPGSSASNANITAMLEKAGCKTFAALIASTGVLKMYQAAAAKGLTVFAPSDGAFQAPNAPDLSKLTNAALISLLQYHALSSYTPMGTLRTTKDPLATLATNGAAKYALTVTTAGDEVTLKAGLDSSRVANTVIDSTPLCIFTVDNLLLPAELFGKAPPSRAPAPAPVPVTSPSPSESPSSSPLPSSSSSPSPSSSPSSSPVVSPPSQAPKTARAPALVLPPPSPLVESPDVAPSGGPSQSANSTAGNASGDLKAPAVFSGLLTVSATVIASVFLS